MPEKQTFTFYLTVEIDAMNDDSALTKLENWVEPTLALKKNADINLAAVEVDESEAEAEPEPEVEKPSVVKSAMKSTKKKRPELKIPEKDDFDYDNIPDWDELEEEEEKPKPSKRKAAPKVEEDDDLDALLAGLEDDEDENHEDTENGDEPEDDDDEDDDWWDDDEW